MHYCEYHALCADRDFHALSCDACRPSLAGRSDERFPDVFASWASDCGDGMRSHITPPNGHDSLHYEVPMEYDAQVAEVRGYISHGRNAGMVAWSRDDRVFYCESRADAEWVAALPYARRQPSNPARVEPCPQAVDDLIASRQRAV